MVVLDTDHMTILERGGTPALALTMRLGALPEAEIATTIVSYEEQCKGWLAKTAREKDEALLRAYRQLGQHLEIYAGMNVLPYDQAAHIIFTSLKNQKIRVGTQDMKIAAIVLAYGAILLTRNTRDFTHIPDLKIEDWSR
jgi:tRNA(fMet)-specific endonuclease VapC